MKTSTLRIASALVFTTIESPSPLKYALEVRIQERHGWVQLLAELPEVFEFRVKPGEFLARPGMALAPMRPALDAAENPLAHVEQLRGIDAMVLMHRDRRALALVERADPHIVRLHAAVLDREAGVDPALADFTHDLADRVRPLLVRHRIFHLVEPRGARAGQDLVAPAHPVPRAHAA